MDFCKRMLEQSFNTLTSNVDKYGKESSLNWDEANLLRGYVNGIFYADILTKEEFEYYHCKINDLVN